MLRQKIYQAVLVLCLVTGTASPVAIAREPAPLSLKQATEQATRTLGGKVVKADTIARDGRAIYKIRLLNDGHVKEVLIDSQSGKTIKP
ncbi:PepSY domain-containing protein [Neptuniibacter halophilus]|uniref:PepSY domain-containing protein n=1 Tax=Neptuniibacter halophilus TaxID=651666 RepID=UPI00257482CD|nr:PepSY domain-containing protein [Neptuniibacter halophilus]